MPIQPVCQLQATTRPTFYPTYKWRTSQILGISHIVLGSLCVAFQAVAIDKKAWGKDIGIGIWGGFVFIATGILCIGAAKRPTRGYILSTFLLSLLSCPVAFAGTAVGILGAEEDGVGYYKSTNTVKIAMNSMLAMLFLCEILVSIWSSVVGGVVCCLNGDGGFDHCDSAACRDCQCNECFSEPLLQDSPTLYTWQMNGPNGPQLVPIDQRTVPMNPNFIHMNPGFMQVNPGTMQVNPGTMPIDPDAMQMHPGTMQMNPGTMPMNPGVMQINPGTMQMNPGTMPINPGVMQTNSGTMQMNPGTIQMNPGTMPMNPGVMQINPSTMHMNPGTMPINPGVMQTNPGTMQMNPGSMQNNPGTIPGNPYAAPIAFEPIDIAPIHLPDQHSSNITQSPTDVEKSDGENSPPPSYEECTSLSNI